MLYPEVWKFSPPESNYKESSGRFETGNVTQIPPPLKDFYFTHLVSVVLPAALNVPQSLVESLTTDCEYYRVPNISLAELVSAEFVQNFVKRGSLTALSVGTRLDADNCVALTPEGVLVLALDKHTFQKLGLEGKPSHFSHNSKERYTVQINLKNDNFITHKKLHQRIVTSLRERLEKFTLILSWTPPEDRVCPSSIAKYLSDLGFKVQSCAPRFETTTAENVKVPRIPPSSRDSAPEKNPHTKLSIPSANKTELSPPENHTEIKTSSEKSTKNFPHSSAKNFLEGNFFPDKILEELPESKEMKEEELFDASELVEWLGMFLLEADFQNEASEEYQNSYECPKNFAVVEKVQVVKSQGLFTVHQVRKIYQKLINFVAPNLWTSLYLQGFSDSPVAWRLQENHYFTNGDNAIVLFLQPSGRFLLCSQSCTNKKHK